MYIDLVRRVLEQAVDSYASRHGITVTEVLQKIREHIDHTAREHRKDEPQIQYQDPLCRLGYLYRHATANATLFELVLRDSGETRAAVRASLGGTLHICSVGGGPGTELLGLTKFLLRRAEGTPTKILFTVLDMVPHWAETWRQLADACEQEMNRSLSGAGPVVAPMFLPVDAADVNGFRHYEYEFGRANIIVFNYLFSECKNRLGDFENALRFLHNAASTGAVFVVIDRLEGDPAFRTAVQQLFARIFGAEIAVHEYGRWLDSDEQTSDMGTMLNKALGFPRAKFFTDQYRDPTVFWFVAVKK